MSIEITMPRLSDTMERGTIVAWNVKEGDKVKPGVVLGDIETDKATMELQSFDTGTVAAILLPQGETVDVAKIILVLAEEGENVAAVRAIYAGGGRPVVHASKTVGTAQAAAAAVEAGRHGTGGASATGTAVADRPQSAPAPANGHHAPASSGAGGRIFVSPLAKKIAEERGIDLSSIHGTGPGGRIIRKDVEDAGVAEAKPSLAAPAARSTMPLPAPSAALESRTVALSNMRGTIAKRLVQSKTTIPHYQVTMAVDLDPLMTLRTQLNEQLANQGVKLSVNDFLVRACALAMHQHPYINASWGADNQSLLYHAQVNIGVAIALPINERGEGGGLVVATLRNADRIGLRQISADTKTLADKARGKGLSIEEMSDATFTISNLGMFGVEHFTAIINPPNAAILAVGAAVQKPVVKNGQIVVGHEMQMTMSSDHRVIDGAMAAQYLRTVKDLLEKPATLLV